MEWKAAGLVPHWRAGSGGGGRSKSSDRQTERRLYEIPIQVKLLVFINTAMSVSVQAEPNKRAAVSFPLIQTVVVL